MSDERELRAALEKAQSRVKELEAARSSAQPDARAQETIEGLRIELAVLRRTQADAVERETAALTARLRELQERASRRGRSPGPAAHRVIEREPRNDLLEQERASHAVTRAALEATTRQLHDARAQLIDCEAQLSNAPGQLARVVRALTHALRAEPDEVRELRAVIVTLRARVQELEAQAGIPRAAARDEL
jgi:chromosome segregation ATPase